MKISTHYSPNYWQGRRNGPPIAVIIHTMAGSLASCTSWFRQEVSQVSAHYGVGLDGEVHKYVGTADTAWTNGRLEVDNNWPGKSWINPNALTVAIETEDMDDGSQVVTEEQYEAVRTLVRTAHANYPSIAFLGGHDNISPHSRPQCPGDRWRASGRLAQLAEETGLQLLDAPLA